METQDKSILEVLQGLLSGETKPEVTVNTEISLENATLLKLFLGCILLIVFAVGLAQLGLRATLKRFLEPRKSPPKNTAIQLSNRKP
ncbi:hypothetical protein P1X15_10805 [Runella sp. MFBS21]|uniref:hypothetical protein n=1 Tax=Runella sp. MFBS21 TaxID=3034018 RepID=UPI0023F70393|nr:hypothetical protein [Runella sp. MFBS21]MDF7818089.1 hypothetical protein [Runella sp. MFBS21]